MGLLVLTLWASTCASTKNDSLGFGRGKRSAGEAAPSYLSIRTKPLLLEPRFSASAPLRGLLHAAWWVVPRNRGRLYATSGEHPAAGGLYVLFSTLGSYPMTQVLFWVASWYLFSIVHDLEAPLWHPRRHFCNLEHMVVSFWYFGGPRGFSLATLGSICATLDVHFDDFLTLWGVPWIPFNTFREKP